MTSNLSVFDNVTSATQVATGANDATGGYLFGLFLLLIFVVAFIVFKNYDTKAVLVGNSFCCTIIAALMWAAGWITFKILIWPVLALFAGIMVLIFWPD